MGADLPRYARIMIPSPLKDVLVYGIPAEIRDRVAPGMRALVPLGKRTVTGIIADILRESPIAETKDILRLPDDQPVMDADLLELVRWTAQYYLTSFGEALRTMLPPGLKTETRQLVTLVGDPSDVCGTWEKRIIEALKLRKTPASLKALRRHVASREFERALARLRSAGIVEVRERAPGKRRGPKGSSPGAGPAAAPENVVLTAEQKRVLEPIQRRLAQGGFEVFLLHGITGSGKTEVYLRAIEQTRVSGRRSLILVPEISLTPQLLAHLQARFPGTVGVLHSALTEAERRNEWRNISRGS
ncbi:MAG TPA: DEAD/DEAH box helicase, partial [Candidatus Eisenbacteria bacterium]|nr:DEAD/DEAH box helicase [Candidatus Eisenbacteria bacterium]